MSAIRMIHPEHGAMHAYDTGEVDRLKGHGWSVEGEKAVPVVGVDTNGDGVIDQVFKKKPGRPKKGE